MLFAYGPTNTAQPSNRKYRHKVNGKDCLRIGAIGRVTVEDVDRLLAAISPVMAEMGLFTASMGAQRTRLTARRS